MLLRGKMRGKFELLSESAPTCRARTGMNAPWNPQSRRVWGSNFSLKDSLTGVH
jgi:hypothetical protein